MNFQSVSIFVVCVLCVKMGKNAFFCCFLAKNYKIRPILARKIAKKARISAALRVFFGGKTLPCPAGWSKF